MKKLLFMLAVCFSLALASCSSKADYDALKKKIDNNEQFSQSDYSAMIDYITESMDKMPANLDFDGQSEWLEKNYPYSVDFLMVAGFAEASGALDSTNKKRMEAVQKKAAEM